MLPYWFMSHLVIFKWYPKVNFLSKNMRCLGTSIRCRILSGTFIILVFAVVMLPFDVFEQRYGSSFVYCLAGAYSCEVFGTRSTSR